jgi:hypothetical protein
METEYSHDWKGKVIPVNFGEGLKFTDYKGRPGTSKKASYREDGLREAILQENTWVGTVAYGAVHYYARIQVRGVRGWTTEDGEHFEGGYGDLGKPKEMMGIEIKIERPTNKKDIAHFKATTNYDKLEWKYMMPKLGSWEYGFWTEAEARAAAIKFFKETFAKGWVLVDPYFESKDPYGNETGDLAKGEL